MDHRGNCHVDPVVKVVGLEEQARAKTSVLRVIGMGCPTCATRVRNSLLSRPGVVQVQIDLFTGLTLVDYDAERIGPSNLIGAVAAAGRDGRHVYLASLLD